MQSGIISSIEHAGALLTADGSDDELIKFEGVSADYKQAECPTSRLSMYRFFNLRYVLTN